MSNSKKNHDLIRQNEKIEEKSQKQDANLQKNTTLYFQVGLIVCLIAVYGLFEMTFETRRPKEIVLAKPIDETWSIKPMLIHPKQPKIEKKEVKKERPSQQPKVVPDDTPDIFQKKEAPTTEPIDPDQVPEVYKIPEEPNIPIDFVEVVPIYPGCEKAKTNVERRECMSQKINRLIQKKFDGTLASEYDLSGVQRISVQFKIDKSGHVTDIKTRASHPKLEEEAARVVGIIPDMAPGKQQNKPVGVVYSLPIVFKVQN